jgi:CubicO group peptidase (beta-lactamase class C family)
MQMLPIFRLAMLGLWLLAFTASAGDAMPNYHEAFRQLHDRGQFNGAVLIVKDSEVLLDDHFGQADASDGTPLSGDSLYRLASVSKTITATALLSLVDAGKLALDDDVRDFLPRFPYRGITVRQLLQHSSGLPEYIFGIGDAWPSGKGLMTNADVLEWLVARQPELAFEPGKGWDYCNTGYALIPLIIEKVSGRPYPAFVRASVFKKAGMADSYHISELGQAQQPRIARGHGFNYATGEDLRFDKHPVLSAEFNGDKVFGAGDIYSTTRDLLAFDRALKANTLLSAALQEQAYASMMLPEGFPAGYGLGWQVAAAEHTGRIIHHHGMGDGYRTRFYRFLDKGITIIILSNAREQYVDEALRVAQQLVFKGAYSLPPLSLAESLSRTLHREGIDSALASVEAAAKAPAQWSVNRRDLNNLAFTYWYRGERDLAVRLLTSFIELMPDDPEVHMTMAEALREERKVPEALRHYRQALEVANKDPKKYARQIREIREVIGKGNSQSQ